MTRQQYPYSSTPIEAIRRFDDKQDARRAVRMAAMAMRSRRHDKPWHRCSLVHVVRSRVAFYAGHDGQRPLSKHDVI